jgi:very-short-patch-repair endonuclease
MSISRQEEAAGAGRFERFGRCVDRCESVPEQLFLVALLFLDSYTFQPFDRAPTIARDRTGLELGQQVHAGENRIDFTLTYPGASKRFAIEIDGYQWHAESRAKFERHTVRQRAVTVLDWTFLRFAAAEVNRDPRKCAAEAMYAAAKLVDGAAPADVAAPVPIIRRRLPVRGSLEVDEPEWWADFEKRLETAVAANDWPAQVGLLEEQRRKIAQRQAGDGK